MGAIAEWVTGFTKLVSTGAVETYNEFSLQHELGVYLRTQIPTKIVEKKGIGQCSLLYSIQCSRPSSARSHPTTLDPNIRPDIRNDHVFPAPVIRSTKAMGSPGISLPRQATC